jgi:hypothetical protein
MRPRGGIIGASITPTQTAASGIWTVREAEAYARSGAWAALPGAPTGVTGTAGNAQVALTWTAPAATGGYAITDYTVQYSSNSGSSWTTFSRSASTATSATVTGLTNGTAYLFRVAAVTVMGTGGYSATFSGSPAGSLLSLAYTAGSWNGTGASGSPYTSSSSFGPINNAVVPFTFTATAECDVTLSFVHNGADRDDNGNKQKFYYRINGTNIPFYDGGYYNSSTGVTVSGQTKGVTVRLTAGETLQIYATGYNYMSTDRLTNISCYATDPTTSAAAMLWNGRRIPWTGSGTSADPWTTAVTAPLLSSSGVIYTGGVTALNGEDIYGNPVIDDGYYRGRNGLNAVFIAKKTCTVTMSASVANVPDDNNNYIALFYGASWPPAGSQSLYTIYEGTTNGSKSITVARGQYFGFWWNSTITNLKVWAT